MTSLLTLAASPKKCQISNNIPYLWMAIDHTMFTNIDPVLKTKLIRN